MKNLTEELLSFDKILFEQKSEMLKKSAKIRSLADEEYEQAHELKKEEFRDRKDKELVDLNNYLETIEEKEKSHFLTLQENLKENIILPESK